MKLSIFVKWICVQILSAECDAFMNQLNASSDVSAKVCIQKTINHVFSYDDTLSLILDNDMKVCEEAIFEMTRPYISLNFHTIGNIRLQLQYEGQFIICPVNESSLQRTVFRMNYTARRYHRTLGNAKILVITNTVDIRQIFWIFWWYGINNVIVLFYRQGVSELYMCDRYSPENACGGTIQLIKTENCQEQVTFSFTNAIHQMNKCPITFFHHRRTIFSLAKEYPSALYVLYVIQELANRSNATFQRVTYYDFSEFARYKLNKTNIILGWVLQKYLDSQTVSEPLVTYDILWLVPKAEQISDMNVFVKVFSCNVWIAVGVTLISVSLAWFLLISWNGRFTFTFEKLGRAFINVWSLTICGSIANFPRSFALRITLLTYLIYVIHIQCALTSNMATILTTPRYGFQISNLEELADSGLPIFIMEHFKMKQFGLNDPNQKLYTRLQKQLRSYWQDELFVGIISDIQNYRNCAAIGSEDDVLQIETVFSKKVNVYSIRDNSMTGVVTIRLTLPTDHFFAPTLNLLISKFEESGIGDKLKNDFKRQCYPKNDSVEEISEELTLPHLAFIFVFLGLGLSISCVVFCLEHVVHKFL